MTPTPLRCQICLEYHTMPDNNTIVSHPLQLCQKCLEQLTCTDAKVHADDNNCPACGNTNSNETHCPLCLYRSDNETKSTLELQRLKGELSQLLPTHNKPKLHNQSQKTLEEINWKTLTKTAPSWLTSTNTSPIVSTRIRLARNLCGWRFPQFCTPEEKNKLNERLSSVGIEALSQMSLPALLAKKTTEDQQKILQERHLCGYQSKPGKNALLFSKDETCALLFNEEDHLRLQVTLSGEQSDTAWEIAKKIEQSISQQVNFAYDHHFGFSTSCATNAGTGMRISWMLNLPGLEMSGQMPQVLHAAQACGLTLRGRQGEGSAIMPGFWQLSNQRCCGWNEQTTLNNCRNFLNDLLIQEKVCRQQLQSAEKPIFSDGVSRAWWGAASAALIAEDEACEWLSRIHAGAEEGLLPFDAASQCLPLLVLTRKAHLGQTFPNETLPGMARRLLIQSFFKELKVT